METQDNTTKKRDLMSELLTFLGEEQADSVLNWTENLPIIAINVSNTKVYIKRGVVVVESNKTTQKPSFFERIFSRWTKWEIYQSDMPFFNIQYQSPLLGGKEICRDRVLVDIYYKENKFTGLRKYKRVKKLTYK